MNGRGGYGSSQSGSAGGYGSSQGGGGYSSSQGGVFPSGGGGHTSSQGQGTGWGNQHVGHSHSRNTFFYQQPVCYPDQQVGYSRNDDCVSSCTIL